MKEFHNNEMVNVMPFHYRLSEYRPYYINILKYALCKLVINHS